MEIYDENGYCNIEKIMQLKTPFIFILGGRGTGKTYGMLKYIYENELPFFYLRRTQKEVDAIKTPPFNPFNALLAEYPQCNIKTGNAGKDILGFFQYEDDKPILPPLGVAGALSTFANIRGFDASYIKLLWFEEFIPEKHKPWIKHEADGFFNAVETLNRNRELNGLEPLKVVLTANSNELNNPIFVYTRLVLKAEQMKKRGQNFIQDIERGYSIVMLDDSPISKKKKDTALYKFVGDTDFSKMSLNNEFSYDDLTNIRSCSLQDYKCLYSVGELGIYKQKNGDRYYICEHVRGEPIKFGTSETELLKFARYGWRLWLLYIDGVIDFETYYCKALFEQYMGRK